MSAPVILSAYRQLQPAEKLFVDEFVRRIEVDAAKNHERISNALYRPIPDDIASSPMFGRPMVTAAITERITEIAAKTELTHRRIIEELSIMAFSNVANYMKQGEDGYMHMPDTWGCSFEQMAAIASYDHKETLHGREIKIRMHNKLEALKMLATYTGMLETDNPYWKADNKATIDRKALPSSASQQESERKYTDILSEIGQR